MRLKKPIAAFVLCSLVWLLPSSQAVVLKAEIEHSEAMAPVGEKLSPGSTFDERNLPGIDTSGQNNWYRIPRWLAGVWHKESQVDYYRYNYRSRQEDNSIHNVLARSDGYWGMQMDSDGGIWEFNPAPYVDTVDGGTEEIVQYIRSSEPVEVSDSRFVNSTVDTQIRLDKATRKILSVQTGEQVTVYIPVSANVIKRDTSSKVFDSAGQPVILGKSYAYEKRVADFQVRDQMNGKNLKALFGRFLAQRAGSQ